MATKSKEELKNTIMHQFEEQNCRANDIVPMRYWYFTFLRSLNPKEQDMFEECVNELVNEGKIIYEKEVLECLRLTQDGYEDLYKVRADSQLEDEIMNRFPTNCRVGDIIRLSTMLTELRKELNPKEYDKMIDIINGLIAKGYISYEKTPFECLRLEEKGFEYIYR